MADEITNETNEIEEPTPVRRKPGRKPGVKYGTPKVVVQQAQPDLDMMEAMMSRLVSEMKKPTEIEARKMAEEDGQKAKLRQMKIAAAKQEMTVKKMRTENCAHQRPDGKHTWVAQVNQDGYFRPICQICHDELPAIKCSQDQLSGGIGLHTYKGLTKQILLNWAAKSPPPPKPVPQVSIPEEVMA